MTPKQCFNSMMDPKACFDFLTTSRDPRITTEHDLSARTTTVKVNETPVVICYEGEGERYEFVEEEV